MRRLVLAIDFDGTIVEEKWPLIGPLRLGAKEFINKLHADGHYIIIWTMRDGKYRLEAEHFMWEQHIHFHRMNENNPASLLRYGGDTRKVAAEIYVDDRSLGGIPSWEEIYRLITERANIAEI